MKFKNFLLLLILMFSFNFIFSGIGSFPLNDGSNKNYFYDRDNTSFTLYKRDTIKQEIVGETLTPIIPTFSSNLFPFEFSLNNDKNNKVTGCKLVYDKNTKRLYVADNVTGNRFLEHSNVDDVLTALYMRKCEPF